MCKNSAKLCRYAMCKNAYGHSVFNNMFYLYIYYRIVQKVQKKQEKKKKKFTALDDCMSL